ncbi:hypothetical protein Hanom_Chr10g00917231 [Helianthus anomalus]
MKCFSHTGFKSCPNDVRGTIDFSNEKSKYKKNRHRKLRWDRNLRWPLGSCFSTVNQWATTVNKSSPP